MMNEKTVWESYTEEEKKKVYDFCEEYRTFLSKCKTERECVQEILKEAKMLISNRPQSVTLASTIAKTAAREKFELGAQELYGGGF